MAMILTMRIHFYSRAPHPVGYCWCGRCGPNTYNVDGEIIDVPDEVWERYVTATRDAAVATSLLNKYRPKP